MGYLILFAIVGGLGWINVRIVRALRRMRAGVGWWMVLVAAWAAGGALGVWGGFFFEYHASPRMRVAGAPIPVAFFHLEGPPGEEQWIDFVTPVPIFNAAINLPLLALAAGCLAGLIFRAWRAMADRPSHPQSRGPQ